jgi:hypothetical protein
MERFAGKGCERGAKKERETYIPAEAEETT